MEQLSFNQSLSEQAAVLSSEVPPASGLAPAFSAERAAQTAPELTAASPAASSLSRIVPQKTVAIASRASEKRSLSQTHEIRREKRTAPSETASEGGNVTEIILPAGQVENMQLLLPMLTQLNQERRWLAWIDPPAELVRKWQQMHGIVTGEILVLRSTDTHDGLSLAKRALSAGTCHAVVMWTPGRLGNGAFRSLQSASADGSSHGVILRQR